MAPRTHAGGNFGAQGQAIYNALRDVQNVHLFTNGHVAAEARRVDDFEGHVINSMLADYQGRPNGGGGLLRIWEFSPANDELTVRTYSPTLERSIGLARVPSGTGERVKVDIRGKWLDARVVKPPFVRHGKALIGI